jgi:hypothetical protein
MHPDMRLDFRVGFGVQRSRDESGHNGYNGFHCSFKG